MIEEIRYIIVCINICTSKWCRFRKKIRYENSIDERSNTSVLLRNKEAVVTNIQFTYKLYAKTEKQTGNNWSLGDTLGDLKYLYFVKTFLNDKFYSSESSRPSGLNGKL